MPKQRATFSCWMKSERKRNSRYKPSNSPGVRISALSITLIATGLLDSSIACKTVPQVVSNLPFTLYSPIRLPVSTRSGSVFVKYGIKAPGMSTHSKRSCWRCKLSISSGVTSSGSASSINCMRRTLSSHVDRAMLIVRRKARGSQSGSMKTSSTPVANMASCRRMMRSAVLRDGASPAGSKCKIKTQTCSHAVNMGRIWWASTSSSPHSKVHGASTVLRAAATRSMSSCLGSPFGSRDRGARIPHGASPQVQGSKQTMAHSSPKCLAALTANVSTTSRPALQLIQRHTCEHRRRGASPLRGQPHGP
mmetsp:Transcript_86078/g.263439  ORF Transcript_86078/g.263439 Transcript_86078/m.263439 type:complete len:307 (+) Transcript_86078:486-1406(+)